MPWALELLPALADVASLLFLYLAFFVCIGLLWCWRNTIGLLLENAADELDSILPHSILGVGLPRIGGPFRALDHNVQGLLSGYARGVDQAIGLLLRGLGDLLAGMAEEIEWFAKEFQRTMTWLLHTYLVGWIKAQLAPLLDIAGVVKWAVHHFGAAEAFARRAVHTAIAGIEAGYKWTHAEIDRLERWALGIDRLVKEALHPKTHKGAQTAAIPALGAIEVPIGRTIGSLKRRLHRVERLLGATAFAAAMANVLGLPSWRCLTKGPLGRLSRALCGIPSKLLTDLLGLLADVWVLDNLCSLIPLVEQGAQDIGVPLVDELVKLAEALPSCQRYRPGELAGRAPSLPAVYFTGTLSLPA